MTNKYSALLILSQLYYASWLSVASMIPSFMLQFQFALSNILWMNGWKMSYQLRRQFFVCMWMFHWKHCYLRSSWRDINNTIGEFGKCCRSQKLPLPSCFFVQITDVCQEKYMAKWWWYSKNGFYIAEIEAERPELKIPLSSFRCPPSISPFYP